MSDSEFDTPAAHSSGRSGLKIIEDFPGSRLNLGWEGSKPWGWLRILIPAAVLSVFIFLGGGRRGPWMMAWEQINGAGPRDLGDDLILGFLICGTLYMLWIGGRLMGQFAGYWVAIGFEATEQILTIQRRGWGIWGNQTTTILFPQLQYIYLRASQEDRGPFPLRLLINYRHREKLIHLTLDFELLGCNRRAEALEFLLSIGRVLQAQGYILGEDNARHAGWQLVLPYTIPPAPVEDPWHDDEDDEKDLVAARLAELDSERDDDDEDDKVNIIPIPVTADFGRDEPEPQGAQPAPVDEHLASQVNLEAINEKLTFAQIVDWRPGKRVRFMREQAPILVYGFAVVFGALAGAGIGGWPVYGFLEALVGHGAIWWPGALGLSAVIGGTAVGFLAWNQFREQSVTIDWGDRTIVFILGSERVERTFEAFRGLVLSGTNRTQHSGIEGSRSTHTVKTEYGSRLDLVLVDRDLPILGTDTWESNQTTARNVLQPLATSLAQSLGLKCTWEPYHQVDAASVRRAFAFTRWQQIVLGILVVVGVVGIGQGVQQRRVRIDAGQAVRNLGGEAVWMNGLSMKNKSVYKEFWKVEFKGDAAIDEHLAKLRPALMQIPELGVEVEGCPLSDEGLKQLDGAVGLRVLTAANVQITDAGLPALGACHELVYLNLFGNQITDAGVRQFLGMTKLRFLFLGRTQVTDAGLLQLEQLKSLEFLHLTGSAVTPEGVRKLRAARPDLDIDYFVPEAEN